MRPAAAGARKTAGIPRPRHRHARRCIPSRPSGARNGGSLDTVTCCSVSPPKPRAPIAPVSPTHVQPGAAMQHSVATAWRSSLFTWKHCNTDRGCAAACAAEERFVQGLLFGERGVSGRGVPGDAAFFTSGAANAVVLFSTRTGPGHSKHWRLWSWTTDASVVDVVITALDGFPKRFRVSRRCALPQMPGRTQWRRRCGCSLVVCAGP